MSSLTCTEARLRFALNYAVLAPSSHNSQPWYFIVDGDTLLLCADRMRALSIVDPFDRELVISCGAALFNLRVALSHFGLGYAITLLPSDAEPDVLAKVRMLVDKGSDSSIASLFDAIPRRVTTREAFRLEAVAPEMQQHLLRAAEAEGVQAVCIDDLRRREEIAQLIAEADRIQLLDPRFQSELASWIHFRRTDDGMPVYGPAVSTLLDIAVPLLASAICTFDLGGRIAAAHDSLVWASPILFCIGTRIDDPQSWLAAGQALERVLLTGVKLGLTASYLNQPVETDQLRGSLRQIAGMTAQPQLLLRMGREPGGRRSGRRPIQDVVS
ncbi:nitroreductase [Caballeronia sp. LjRoot34]|uniref:Acg family FMN-binding oxidoreductase n=1 Tax=Caballeronia sp. LjRoot34 TaxID=3342325 RepID=UPI003ECE1C11